MPSDSDGPNPQPGMDANTQFSFVIYQGPTLPRDTKTRTLIRRRAMRDVAADRKRKGSDWHGRHANRGQYPVLLQAPSDAVAITGRDLSVLQSLAQLTGLRLGLGFAPGMPQSPGVQQRGALAGSKFVSFIPSRYGHRSGMASTEALTRATDCVLAKRHSMLVKGSREDQRRILVRYTEALRALQAALDDEGQRSAPETLCAAQLLGIFELLSGDGNRQTWIHHVGGATRLMEVQGAISFGGEFEMALLTAHVGPAVTEAFLSNKPCFLAEPPWLDVMYAAIRGDESLAEYTDLVLALWGHLVDGPAIFKMTTDLVCSPTSPPQSAINDLIRRILRDWAMLFEWLCMAQSRIGLPSAVMKSKWRDAAVFPLSGDELRDWTQLALRGTYATCRMLKARLLVALAPARFRHLEGEAQELAERILSLDSDTLPASGILGHGLVGSLFVSQSSWLARAIVETKDVWVEGLDVCPDGMVERSKFEAWCAGMGRKLSS